MNPTAELAGRRAPRRFVLRARGTKIGFEISQRRKSADPIPPRRWFRRPARARPDTDIIFDPRRPPSALPSSSGTGDIDAAYRHQLGPTRSHSGRIASRPRRGCGWRCKTRPRQTCPKLERERHTARFRHAVTEGSSFFSQNLSRSRPNAPLPDFRGAANRSGRAGPIWRASLSAGPDERQSRHCFAKTQHPCTNPACAARSGIRKWSCIPAAAQARGPSPTATG